MNAAPAESNAPAAVRWGLVAPPLLRGVTLMAWLSLVTRLVASALPGSRSGIEPWIRRADVASSILTQLSVLLGASLLVLLVVNTVADRGFRLSYRIAIVPAAAVVLMLVMLASTATLPDAAASVFLGVASLVIAVVSAGTALGTTSTRALGLVLTMVLLGGASRFTVRVMGVGNGAESAWSNRTTWGLAMGSAFDVFAAALAATRLLAERRRTALYALGAVLVVSAIVAWGALNGSLEGARMWQIVAARSLSDLGSSPSMAPPSGGVFALDALTLLLAGAIAIWPAPLSAGMVAAGLVLLSRPGVDVPVSALLLSLGALAAPLGASFETLDSTPKSSPGARTHGRESTASADG
jgi:hypothetical protein